MKASWRSSMYTFRVLELNRANLQTFYNLVFNTGKCAVSRLNKCGQIAMKGSSLCSIKICDDTRYLSKVRNAWNEQCSKDADGKNPVCNLSNTIFTTGKSIRAFRLILHGGALQQIESRLIAK